MSNNEQFTTNVNYRSVAAEFPAIWLNSGGRVTRREFHKEKINLYLETIVSNESQPENAEYLTLRMLSKYRSSANSYITLNTIFYRSLVTRVADHFKPR